jgi:signal transduction histidine kinase
VTLLAPDKSPRLAAVLGHELRNPLAAALTGVALAVEMTDEGDPRRAVLDRATTDLMRVGDLLSSYLAFGGGRVADNAIVDPVECVTAAVARHRAARLTVAPSVRAGMRVRGNRNLIVRVVENLLENAVHAGATRVDVTVRAAGTRFVLDVADDGPGVPPELCERLFEFGVTGGGGSGIGLALARTVVESCGGSVDLAPSTTGARFVVELPLLTATES